MILTDRQYTVSSPSFIHTHLHPPLHLLSTSHCLFPLSKRFRAIYRANKCPTAMDFFRRDQTSLIFGIFSSLGSQKGSLRLVFSSRNQSCSSTSGCLSFRGDRERKGFRLRYEICIYLVCIYLAWFDGKGGKEAMAMSELEEKN